MVPRNLLCSLALAPCLTLVCASQAPKTTAPTEPPAPQEPQAKPDPKAGDLVKTVAHGSRWDYPKEFTIPGGFKLHIVERGDTLWDLGQKYLGNPYAWPQIWEHNKWIKDPHWIFPGDPLLVPDDSKTLAKAGEAPSNIAPPAVANMEPDTGSSRFRREISAEFAYSFQDFLQLPYLAAEGAEAHFKTKGGIRITGGENSDRANFGDGDKIFLDGGQEQNIKIGDRRVVLKVVRKKLYHPNDSRRVKPLGDVLQQIGVARIVHVTAKGSIAIIERALDGIQRGQVLVPFAEPPSIPLVLRKGKGPNQEPEDPLIPASVTAKIIHIGDAIGNVANGAQVIIDKGTRLGLKVGDMLLATQEDTWSVGNPRDRVPAKERTFRYLGQAVVVHADQDTATCRVVRAKDALQVGTMLFK